MTDEVSDCKHHRKGLHLCLNNLQNNSSFKITYTNPRQPTPFYLMKTFHFSILFTFFLLVYFLLDGSFTTMAQPGVVINEIMSSNQSSMADEDGDYPDWIELYNAGSDTVNLEGWGLSDNYMLPFKWVFPGVTIYPDEYLLVWASGKDRKASPATQKLIIPEKSEWKYLDDGSNQETQWRMPEFDDSTWNNGEGMLGYDTNNNTDFGTQISFGSNSSFKHVTYYFRKEFEVVDKDKYLELEIKLMIDDGAVVYLNGQEVIRQNMPGGDITYATFANVIVGTLEISYHLIDASILKNGTNVIAVEVHQCNRTSSDLRFDLKLLSRGRYLHSNFSISSSGEEIVLTHPLDGLVDSIPPHELPTNISLGRWPNGTNDFFYYSGGTPGMPNPEERYHQFLQPPVFSHKAGFYDSPFELTITADPEAEIIYTLDGSEPDPDNLEGTTFSYKNSFPGSLLTSSFRSLDYTEPLYIQDRTPLPEFISTFASDFNGARYTSQNNRLFKGTVIRARAIKENAVPSPEVVHTFFVTPNQQNRYSLAVLSLTTQPNYLFDYYTGMYTPGVIWEQQANGTRNGGAPANYKMNGMEWEKSAYLEFFERDSLQPVIAQQVGIRNHGGWSRAHPMKSIRIYARNSYDIDYFHHSVFPDLPHDKYKRILLRNSGNDWGRTMLRDAAIQAIFENMNADIQAYRPIILFLNGEYWGIHNIRERYDKYYFERTYGVDAEKIDLIEIVARTTPNAKQGSMAHYNQLSSFLATMNMSVSANYQHAQTLMDVENFIDYQIGQIYSANTDWPGNNNDFWRLQTDSYKPYTPYGHDGRWRWLIFDTDFGFNGTNGPTHNTVAFATAANGPSWPNPPHSTLFLRRLLLNQEFRNHFINRFADLLNTYFLPTRVSSIIDQLSSTIAPEMAEHIRRWGRPGSYSGWQNDINNMISFGIHRPSHVRQHITNHFNLAGTARLTLDVSDPAHGKIKVNTIEISTGTPGVGQKPYPWFGDYFRGVPVYLEAMAAPGYIFSYWEGADEPHSPIIHQTLSQNSVSIKAHFISAETLYSWDFNNLPQGNLENIIAGYSLPDQGIISYQGTSEGYMDRVTEGTELNALSDIPAGSALRVRNPAIERQLVIEAPTTGFSNVTFSYATMRTPNGAAFQQIQYRSTSADEWKILEDAIEIKEQWSVKRFNLPTETYNNPYFAIRILFLGDQTEGPSGNNRFDNIRIEGYDITTSNKDPLPGSDLHIEPQQIKFWHSNGAIHIYNPFPDNSEVAIFQTNGLQESTFIISGKGQHSIPFNAGNGVYIVRLKGKHGAGSGKIIVINSF
jgi:hypothetical protein